MKAVNALGRRKSAVARVYVVPGKGEKLRSMEGTSTTISRMSLSVIL